MDERDRFDKFTERARKVLSLAQEEARLFQHNYIGTEHLLLGLVSEGEGVAAKVLANLGVELNKVRSAVEFIIGRGDRIVLGEIGLTPRAKKVVELAIDEARLLNHRYIGTEHLLLGLVREGQGIAAGVLESLGVNLEDTRAQTMKLLVLVQEPLSQPEQQEPVQHASSHEALEQEKDLGNTTSKREASPLEVSQPFRPFVKDRSDTFTGQARNVSSGHFFIAYSRRDFYFAESLFYALHSRGINAWMDVWKITPGDDWDQAITDAIRYAQGLILIATRESLHSRYVKDEIRQAHRAGKPIYLVIRGRLSAQDLLITPDNSSGISDPIDLRKPGVIRAVVDMGAGFARGVDKIKDAIFTNRIYQGKLPDRFSFKMEPILYLPPIIALLALLMVATQVWKFGIGILYEDDLIQILGYLRDILHGAIGEILFLVPAMIKGIISIGALINIITFCFNFSRRRRISISYFALLLISVALTELWTLFQEGVAFFLDVYFVNLGTVLHVPGEATPSLDKTLLSLVILHLFLTLLTAILMIIFGIIYYWGGGRGAILRWLPTGYAVGNIRQKGNAVWIKNLPDIRVSKAPRYTHYRIVASEEDSSTENPVFLSTAQKISTLFQERGDYTITSSPAEAECDLVILSPFTDERLLRQEHSSKPVIYVLARSIRFPKDTSAITTVQWIDYRRLSANQFWKQWERDFKQLKGKSPVFPYVPEAVGDSLVPPSYGFSIWFMMGALIAACALLIAGMGYLFLSRIPVGSVPLAASMICLLVTVSLSYYIAIQMLRGIISPGGVKGWLIFAGILAVLATLLTQSPLLILGTLAGIRVIVFLAKRAWPYLAPWLPPVSKSPDKKSLLQPVSRYRVFTSTTYGRIMIAGFLGVNTLITNFWVVPNIPPRVVSQSYVVTVPGPYDLDSTGVWSQDTYAEAFGYHFAYHSDKLEVSQDQTRGEDMTWLKFLGVDASPMRFAPHFRSSVHVHFTNNAAQTTFGLGVNDFLQRADNDLLGPQFLLSSNGLWTVSEANGARYSGQLTDNELSHDYTLEMEINGILCIYKINGKAITTIADPSLVSLQDILLTFINAVPGGTTYDLSHFTYAPIPGPVLSREEALKFVAAQNNAPYRTAAPGWNCNPRDGRWNGKFEPEQQGARLTCTAAGTRLNGGFLYFDNSAFGELPTAFDYSFDAAFQGTGSQCILMQTYATVTPDGKAYAYVFLICSNGNWALRYAGFHTKDLSGFLLNQLRSGHIAPKRAMSVFVEFRSTTQRFYLDKQLIVSYTAPKLMPTILFGNGQGVGAVMYSNFSYVPITQQ